jgi:L-threonylcarbamoyladenylate synthase
LHIKQRPVDKGLILLSSRLRYCEPFIDIDDDARETLRQPCEQPTTWLVKASPACPFWIRGSHSSVAIRLTDHPLMRDLCARLHLPLVSTSANRAGRPAARNALQLRREFGDELDFIVTGFDTGGSRPSAIKSLASGTTLRPAS